MELEPGDRPWPGAFVAAVPADGHDVLAGLTVLDFSSIGPGPRCSRLLADYGMRVIKIRPPAGGSRVMEAPWFAYSANRGLDELRIDLKSTAGRDLGRRLARRSDCLIDGFRPGVAERLGIGYRELSVLNPQLVYCSISGYGQSGPAATRPAHDLNWIAQGGLLDAGQRRADGGPAIPGGTIADALGGYSAAVAILAALTARAAGAGGRFLDVAVADGVLRAMQFVLDGEMVEPGGVASEADLVNSAWYDVYPTKDGRWLAVGAVEPHFWANLCRGVGLPDLVDLQHDRGQQDRIRSELTAVFRTRPRADWLQLLRDGTCISAVNTPAEVLEEPDLQGRPLVVDVALGERTVRQLAPRLPIPDPVDPREQRIGPGTVAEADALLGEFGCTAEEIDGLRSDGVLG
jgi:alpha-methylacyl-CoA racemase